MGGFRFMRANDASMMSLSGRKRLRWEAQPASVESYLVKSQATGSCTMMA
jgi:hypothetical protein